MKRHEKLDKKANELADELNKLELDSRPVDTLPEMTSSAAHSKLARRHSVDIINSSTYYRRGSTGYD
jgi:hypothetical protein